MDRRELLRRTALGLGVAVVPKPLARILDAPVERDLVPAELPPAFFGDVSPLTYCSSAVSGISWVDAEYFPRFTAEQRG